MTYNNRRDKQQNEIKHIELTDNNYVDIAETVMGKLCQQNDDIKRTTKETITTSKIRGMLSNISGIYNDVMRVGGSSLSEDIVSRLKYLKVQFIYEAGREKSVKRFIDQADILYQIDSIGNDRSKFIRFERYMEALVAYHKFYGGE